MLANPQILHLLARCEAASGRVLTKIRQDLQRKQWMSAVWELVVGEAASQLGQIKYEVSKEGGRPDWPLQFKDGERVWIDAAFRFEPRETIRRPEDHPLYRVLNGKEDQANRARLKEPFIVCVSTDRVFSLDTHSRTRDQSRDQAIESFWERSVCISAVIVALLLLRSELFSGFAREAKPIVRENPNAHVLLPKYTNSYLQKLDFNRWDYSLSTVIDPGEIRQDLVNAVKQLENRTMSQSSLDSQLDDAGTQDSLPRPAWSYSWQFHELRIAKVKDSYWLFDGREVIGKFSSAEEAAEVASDDFQWFPAHVMGPSGIQRNSDKGVPPNLDEWQLDQ